jgi:hypothetical protein
LVQTGKAEPQDTRGKGGGVRTLRVLTEETTPRDTREGPWRCPSINHAPARPIPSGDRCRCPSRVLPFLTTNAGHPHPLWYESFHACLIPHRRIQKRIHASNSCVPAGLAFQSPGSLSNTPVQLPTPQIPPNHLANHQPPPPGPQEEPCACPITNQHASRLPALGSVCIL